MTTPYDVPPGPLIEALAAKLRAQDAIQAPPWATYAKTGVHREKAPVSRDWWQVRVAAVLRHVYVDGPVGVERLRADFGGPRDRGARPEQARKGSGSIAREALQQLEAAKLVENQKGKGRVVSAQGRSLVDNTAHEVRQKLQERIPALAKY